MLFRSKALAMPISHIIPSFSLYCPTILLGQSIQHLELPRPFFILWASSARSILWASLAHFILSYFFHSHGLLLNLLGFPDPITTSFAFGFIGLRTNPIYQLLSLGSSGPFLLSFYFLRFSRAYYFILWHFLDPFVFFGPLIILWAYGPLFLPFWPNGLYIAAFFLHSFHIIGLFLPLDPFVKKWASTIRSYHFM